MISYSCKQIAFLFICRWRVQVFKQSADQSSPQVNRSEQVLRHVETLSCTNVLMVFTHLLPHVVVLVVDEVGYDRGKLHNVLGVHQHDVPQKGQNVLPGGC